MDVKTETDAFIAAQVGPLLRPFELPLSAAYLTTQTGSLAAALMARAFYAVLTNERLILIETRVGAFRPVLENIGVGGYERSQIAGAHVGWNQLILQLVDGRKETYLCVKKHVKVSTQTAFRETIQREHGTGPIAESLAKRHTFATVGGILLTIVIVVVVFYTTYKSDAKVEVRCQGGGGQIACALTHTGGGADAHVCWDLALTCEDGKTLKHHVCGDVAPAQVSNVAVPEADIRGLESCGLVTKFDITDVEVNADR